MATVSAPGKKSEFSHFSDEISIIWSAGNMTVSSLSSFRILYQAPLAPGRPGAAMEFPCLPIRSENLLTVKAGTAGRPRRGRAKIPIPDQFRPARLVKVRGSTIGSTPITVSRISVTGRAHRNPAADNDTTLQLPTEGQPSSEFLWC